LLQSKWEYRVRDVSACRPRITHGADLVFPGRPTSEGAGACQHSWVGTCKEPSDGRQEASPVRVSPSNTSGASFRQEHTGLNALFSVTVSPLELFIRGTLMYVGLVLVVRFVLRRDVGTMGTADLLFIVLVADAAQNAMAGEYRSVTDGVVLLATLVFWNMVLDWLAYRSAFFRALIEPPPLPLIRNGRLHRRNLKKEWITMEEMLGKLREHGIDDVRDVRLATLEADGELSVLRYEPTGDEATPRHRRAGGA